MSLWLPEWSPPGPVGVPGRDAPLRRADVDDAVAYVRGRERRGRGGVYFLVGPPEAGGARVLDAIQGALWQAPGRRNVVRASLESGRFEVIARHATRSVIDRAEDVAKLVKPLIPYAAQPLVAVLTEISAAALRLFQDIKRGVQTDGDPVTSLLKAATAEWPLVLLVDRLDSENAAWFSELLGDAWGRDVAVDLRVVFVATLDGPENLPSTESGLSHALRAATRLQRSSLTSASTQGASESERDAMVRWRPLARLERNDVEAWLGPADESLVRHLWEASGGIPTLVESVWEKWIRARAIEAGADGAMRFTTDADVQSAVDLRTAAQNRVRALVPAEEDTPCDVLLALNIGALQGESFTADAVARVLGLDSRDVLVDLLDSRVGEGVGPHAIVQDAGYHDVAERDGEAQYLCRYRFTSTALWMGLRTRGLAPEERRDYARRLANALQELYGSHSEMIASSLAALFALAGDLEIAARWERIREEGSDPDLLRWRAHLVLGANHDRWTAPERAHGVQLLYDAYRKLFDRVPRQESAQYARTAQRLADGAESRVAQAQAARSMAAASAYANDFPAALRHGRDALAAWKAVPDLSTAALTALEFARILRVLASVSPSPQRPALRREVDELLEFARQEGSSSTAADALLTMAGRTQDQRRVRELIQQALTITPTRGAGLHVRCMAWRQLAYLELRSGDPDRARKLLIDVEKLCEADNDLMTLVFTLDDRRAVELAAGRFVDARAHFSRAHDLAAKLEFPGVAARISIGIAFAEEFLGGHARAAAMLANAETLAESDGDRKAVAAGKEALDLIAEARAAGEIGPSFARDAYSLQRSAANLLFHRSSEVGA